MQNRFKKPACPLLVFTDLDGTLLDHDSYSFEAALPAIERLKALAVPIIPVSSKTLAELELFTRELDLDGPCIAENGGLIAYPAGYFESATGLEHAGRFDIEYLSPHYSEILAALGSLREHSGFRFSGFADLSDTEVAELTGLSPEDSKRARARLCSEPLVWQDSASALDAFSRELEAMNFTQVKGGRFSHVLGNTDKAVAINKLLKHYTQAGFGDFTTIALGDSPNDAKMLAAADIAVIVRRKDGSWLEVERQGESVKTRASGPAGWNEFFQYYLDRLSDQKGTRRTLHG